MKVQEFEVTQMPTVSVNNNADAKGNTHTLAEIQAWLVSYLAESLEIDPDEVDVTIPFDRYGLDSSAAVGLIGELEDWLGCELDPTLLYDYPTIEVVALYLACQK
jgi:acyl carrier protein